MIGPSIGWSSTESSRWVQRRTGVSLIDRSRRDLARPALEVDEVAFDRLVDAAARRGEHVVDRGLKLGDAAAAHRDRLDHRHAELSLDRRRVELEAVAPGEVDHVERDDGRQPELDQLECEAQVVVEVGGIEDDHQRVRLALALLLAEQDVAGDGFVGAGRIEAVGAGQVDQLDRSAVAERQPARMAFDRDPGIIADLLASAGQRIEQRALAGIGTAGDGDERERDHLRIAGLRAPRRRACGGSRRSCGRRGSRSDRGRTARGAAPRPSRLRQSRNASGDWPRPGRAPPNRSRPRRALVPTGS